jgi:hypothetical protein
MREGLVEAVARWTSTAGAREPTRAQPPPQAPLPSRFPNGTPRERASAGPAGLRILPLADGDRRATATRAPRREGPEHPAAATTCPGLEGARDEGAQGS